MASIKPYKAGADKPAKRRPFTIEELKSLVKAAPNDFWKYMVLGGFYTGLRLGDLICLTWRNVEFDHTPPILRVTPRKTANSTGVEIRIPIAPPLLAHLKEVRKKAGKVDGADYLWKDHALRYQSQTSAAFSNAFHDRVMVPAGLRDSRKGKKRQKQGRDVARESKPLSFHCLRHSFVTQLKAAGGSQAVAKQVAGHSNDAISDLYTTLPTETLVEPINNLPKL